MDAFIAAYWPAIVAGFAFGIIAGFFAFRPKPTKKD